MSVYLEREGAKQEAAQKQRMRAARTAWIQLLQCVVLHVVPAHADGWFLMLAIGGSEWCCMHPAHADSAWIHLMLVDYLRASNDEKVRTSMTKSLARRIIHMFAGPRIIGLDSRAFVPEGFRYTTSCLSGHPIHQGCFQVSETHALLQVPPVLSLIQVSWPSPHLLRV
eukprot:361296-Pelagomonas_calceolata.AAC.4